MIHCAGGARRRPARIDGHGAPGAGLRPQGRGRLEPARADAGIRTSATSSLLLDRRDSSAPRARPTTRPPTLSSTPRGSAASRRASPPNSIAWGLWLGQSGMAGRLGEADLARMRRGGDRGALRQQGLALFDRVLADGPTALALGIAARFDRAALRGQAAAGALPPILGAGPGPAASPGRGLDRRAAAAPARAAGGRAESTGQDLVRAEVAAILGHASADGDRPRRSLQGPRLRLARGGGAAQPARACAAGRAPGRLGDLRLPDLGRCLADPPARARTARGRAGGRPPVSSPPCRPRIDEEASDEELLDFIDAQVGVEPVS